MDNKVTFPKAIFKKDLANKIHIETLGGKSIFEDIYASAFKMCADIVNSFANKNDSKNSDDFNNTIAFIGSKGIGKTSIMRNFATMLEDNKLEKEEADDFVDVHDLKVEREIIKEFHFKTFGFIDPTLLSEEENLLEYIAGFMFKSFKDFLDERHLNAEKFHEIVESESYKKLLKAFDELHNSMSMSRKARKGEASESESGSLKAFDTIAANSTLKKDFKELVKAFRDFLAKHDGSKDDRKKYCLVIQIDDMDLLTHNAFEFSEEIKKFMMVSNVLILINFDIDLYSQELLNHNLASNKKLEMYANRADYDDLRKRTREQLIVVAKYLDKLFPMNHRAVIPQRLVPERVREYEYKEKRISKYEKEDKTDSVQENEKRYFTRLSANSLEQFVFCPIYYFTRMRYPFKSFARIYIPSTLRELHNFITTLYQETDGIGFPTTEDAIYPHIYDWFASEMIYRWGKEYLTRAQFLLLISFWDAPDERKFKMAYEFYQNKEGSLNLLSHESDNNKDKIKRHHNFERYFKKSGKKNPTVGDIIYMTQYFSERDLTREGRWEHFNFALLSLISLQIKTHTLFNNNDNSQSMNLLIPDDEGYFGYSSLRLMNVYVKVPDKSIKLYLNEKSQETHHVNVSVGDGSFKLSPDSNNLLTTLPIGRIEYRGTPEIESYIIKDSAVIKSYKIEDPAESIEYAFHFNELFEMLRNNVDKELKDEDLIVKLQSKYRALELLFFFIDFDDYKFVENDVLTGFKKLNFDVMNPCYRVLQYNRRDKKSNMVIEQYSICYKLRNKVLERLNRKGNEIAEKNIKSLSFMGCNMQSNINEFRNLTEEILVVEKPTMADLRNKFNSKSSSNDFIASFHKWVKTIEEKVPYIKESKPKDKDNKDINIEEITDWIKDNNNVELDDKEDWLVWLKTIALHDNLELWDRFHDRYPPVPLLDLVYMSDMLSNIEHKCFSYATENCKEKGYKQAVEVIPKIYKEFIGKYLKKQDDLLLNNDVKFKDKNNDNYRSANKAFQEKRRRPILEIFNTCPIIGYIKDENGEYIKHLAKIIEWLIEVGVPNNYRMGIEDLPVPFDGKGDTIKISPQQAKTEATAGEDETLTVKS